MAAVKKTIQRRKPIALARASSNKVTRKNTKTKFLLPPPGTTALEKSLEPGGPNKKTKDDKKSTLPKRSLVLPGYIAFTVEVWHTIWTYKSTFWRLVVVYALLSGLFVGLASQSVYTQISSLLRETGSEIMSGDTGKLGEAGDLLLASLTGVADPAVDEAQQLIGGLLVILVWLTTIWLLRAFLAGHTPRLRDGFYNSGSPLVPTLLLSFVLVAQLIPAAIAAIAVSAAAQTGLVDSGVVMALFWIVALLLIVLSLYWMTSTFIALIVVTLPGMYPLKALKAARELVSGRRLRIVLRIVWLLCLNLILWVVIMVPVILFDAAIKGVWQAVEWLPIVPVAFLFVGSGVVVWTASYTYLLYRKVVDYDSVSV